MYDTDQMGLVDTMHGHLDAVLSIDSLRKERCLACGSQDRSIRLWKVEEESQLVRLRSVVTFIYQVSSSLLEHFCVESLVVVGMFFIRTV